MAFISSKAGQDTPRASVLALSAGSRLLVILPLLLAVWLAVAWAMAD